MSAADAAAELAASRQRWFASNSTSSVQSMRNTRTHEFVSWNGDQQPRSSSGSSFVKTRGKQFVLNGRPMYVNGANFYWLMTAAANPYTRSQVTQVLEEAASVGLTVGRAWAFNDGIGYETLQSSPGVFNEYVFRGLDFAVAEAKRFGIRLILSLVNGNPTWGGKQQYVDWAQEYAGIYLPDEDSFFTDPTIMSWYKNFVKTLLTRVNTVTGVAYKDEPAIFAWELINEPRCVSDPSGDSLQAWIVQMAAFVKSLDQNHLLEVGLEGFYSGESLARRGPVNPFSYAAEYGTDFFRDNQVPGIDFTTVHAYPDIWIPELSEAEMIAYMQDWMNSHIDDSYYLNKPVMFTEFGKSSSTRGFREGQRDLFMAAVYDTIYESARKWGPASGALVWQLTTNSLLAGSQDGFAFVLSQFPTTASVMHKQSFRMGDRKSVV